jgi:hypothetical protein
MLESQDAQSLVAQIALRKDLFLPKANINFLVHGLL